MAFLVLFFALVTAATVDTQSEGAPTNDEAQPSSACRYDLAIRTSNAARSWNDFEFDTQKPGGPMWYNSRGCYVQAVEAARDYLATGPLLTTRQHAITTFHMSRNLARSGADAGTRAAAALLAAASRRADQAPDAALDWNTYVTGFTAYLTGDRVTLERARDALIAAGGEGNMTNAAVLARAARCIERPFLDVETSEECSVKQPDRTIPSDYDDAAASHHAPWSCINDKDCVREVVRAAPSPLRGRGLRSLMSEAN